MSYTFTCDIDKDSYERFVTSHEYCNLLQSYNWAKVKSNWDHIYTAVYNDDELLATGLVLIRRLPMKFTMFYLPRGPIMDYKNETLVKFYFDNLKKLAKKYHCLFIKFDPAIHVNDYFSYDHNDDRYEDTDKYLKIFENIGAIHHGFTMKIEDTVQPRFQSNVYASEDIEATLPKHTKRLIKDANRRNVRIVSGQKEFIDEFSRLVALTEERKGVALRNHEYFETLMDNYPDGGVIFLAMVNVYRLNEDSLKNKAELEKQLATTPENAVKKQRRLNDQINSINKDLKEYQVIFDEFGKEDKDIAIAGILSIQYGKTCEMLYAGMDERFKKFMPQYKEYVENFKWAFERGCLYSNMGGVEGSLDDGLTKFKDNFSPTINEFIGEFDLPVNKLLFNLSEKLYKKMRERTLK